ncbi:unnamed protein product [Amoebophrya sp. A25]|nr:unnamed protein product [Amoebophrya sp. A25]|eukprot:GSA25T00018039001.1
MSSSCSSPAAPVLGESARLFLHANAGALASALAGALLFPLDVIRARAQVPKNPGSRSSTIRDLYKQGGMGAFYTGLCPVITTIGVSQFLYFYLFELLKSLRIAQKVLSSSSTAVERESGALESRESGAALESFVGSLLAGVLNMLLTEPLWKANMQCMLMRRGGQGRGNRGEGEGKGNRGEEQGQRPGPGQRSRTSSSAGSSRSRQEFENGEDISASIVVVQAEDEAEDASTSSTASSNNVFVVAYQIAQEKGLWSLWDGLGTSLYLVSNPMIQYALYDILKKRATTAGGGILAGSKSSGTTTSASSSSFPSESTISNAKSMNLNTTTPNNSLVELSPVRAFLLGSFTKAVATVFTYPLQVAQTRMRAGGTRTMWSCLVEIYREADGGLSGFFKGLAPKMVQTVSQAAFMFAFYEALLTRITATYHKIVVPSKR